MIDRYDHNSQVAKYFPSCEIAEYHRLFTKTEDRSN